jgi:hypothetical protein
MSGDFSVGIVFYMLAESVIAAAELNVDPSRLSQLRAWLIVIWSLEVTCCLAACIARPLTNLESMGLILYAYNLLVLLWAACFFLLKIYQVCGLARPLYVHLFVVLFASHF